MNLIAARFWRIDCFGDEEAEPCPIVVPRMTFSDENRATRNHDTDIALIEFGYCMRRGGDCVGAEKNFIVIGETDPIAARMNDMDMGSSAKGTGGKGRNQIARIERDRVIGLLQVDEDSLATGWAVSPFRCGVLGAEDEE